MSTSSHSPSWDGTEMPPSITGDLHGHQETSQSISLGQCSCFSHSPMSNCPSSPTPGGPIPALRRNITMPGTGQRETLVGPDRCSHGVQVMTRHHDTSSKHDINIGRASMGSLLGAVLNPTR